MEVYLKGQKIDYILHSCAMFYGSETWPVKMKDVLRLESNDAKMIRWMCNVNLGIGFLQRN